MLRSLYIMLDYHIAANDGEVGRVEDSLFDDESWTESRRCGSAVRLLRSARVSAASV